MRLLRHSPLLMWLAVAGCGQEPVDPVEGYYAFPDHMADARLLDDYAFFMLPDDPESHVAALAVQGERQVAVIFDVCDPSEDCRPEDEELVPRWIVERIIREIGGGETTHDQVTVVELEPPLPSILASSLSPQAVADLLAAEADAIEAATSPEIADLLASASTALMENRDGLSAASRATVLVSSEPLVCIASELAVDIEYGAEWCLYDFATVVGREDTFLYAGDFDEVHQAFWRGALEAENVMVLHGASRMSIVEAVPGATFDCRPDDPWLACEAARLEPFDPDGSVSIYDPTGQFDPYWVLEGSVRHDRFDSGTRMTATWRNESLSFEQPRTMGDTEVTVRVTSFFSGLRGWVEGTVDTSVPPPDE